jgi:glycosyltransferase involved in cell wall biosynthesis
MRLCIFDRNGGGHNPKLMRRIAEAVPTGWEVVLAAPARELELVEDSGFERHDLGEARPRPARRWGRYESESGTIHKREMARAEIELARDAAAETGADQMLFGYADPLLRWLASGPPFPVPHSIVVMKARAHYPHRYGTPLGPVERLRAAFQERLVSRWRRRRDAVCAFAMDPVAAEGWSRKPGCRSVWLPDSISALPAPPAGPRRGCLMFGYIEKRKGLGLLSDALSEGAAGTELVVAGTVAPEYRERFDAEIERLRAGGVEVDARPRRIDEPELARELASTRCVVLPYVDHFGSSGVLGEAAEAGTPVVATNRGLLGDLVRRYEMGLLVDPGDPAALRRAVLELSGSEHAGERFQPGLRRYAEDFGKEALAAAVREGITGERAWGASTSRTQSGS